MSDIKKIPLTSKEREALLKAKKILEEKFDLEKLVLFGSKVRGESDSESDVDLLVVCNHPMSRSEKHKITDELFYINLEYGTNLSSLVVDRDNWEHGPFSVLPIHDEIEREGVAI